MTAEKLLREGRLDDALAALKQHVRKHPANARARIFLFQLLCVLGDWERALTQLSVAGELDAGALAMVQTYREAINCEALRAEIFQGERSPLIFGDPEPWIAMFIQAISLSASGNQDEANKLRERAFEEATATAGRIDGKPFEWIADADPRLGPLLEAVVNGRYYWIPFSRIAQIKIEAPADLRDVVWTPVIFTWANGGQAAGLIPLRYPDSQTSDDDLIRMAKKTDWRETNNGFQVGLGQRMLATDVDDYALMDVREITLETSETAAEMTDERDAQAEPEG